MLTMKSGHNSKKGMRERFRPLMFLIILTQLASTERGRIALELATLVPSYQQSKRRVLVQPLLL
jgi:hypothetical protein